MQKASCKSATESRRLILLLIHTRPLVLACTPLRLQALALLLLPIMADTMLVPELIICMIVRIADLQPLALALVLSHVTARRPRHHLLPGLILRGGSEADVSVGTGGCLHTHEMCAGALGENPLGTDHLAVGDLLGDLCGLAGLCELLHHAAVGHLLIDVVDTCFRCRNRGCQLWVKKDKT